MYNDMTPAVAATLELHLEGNVIPHTWYQHIKFPSGKVDAIGCLILADIYYWYRPTVVHDETTGEVIGYRKKFQGDKLHKSYQALANQFGISKRQASDACHRLQKNGLITIELRDIQTEMGCLRNVTFIEPVMAAIKTITLPPERETSNVETCGPSRSNVETCDVSRSGVGPSTPEREYTKNTTETTTDISVSGGGDKGLAGESGALAATAHLAAPSTLENHNRIRAKLESYFCELTHIPPPKCGNERQRKAAGQRWWSPLREIAELTEWHEDKACALLRETCERMITRGLTISAPQSVLNVAIAVHAEKARPRLPNEQTYEYELADIKPFSISTGETLAALSGDCEPNDIQASAES